MKMSADQHHCISETIEKPDFTFTDCKEHRFYVKEFHLDGYALDGSTAKLLVSCKKAGNAFFVECAGWMEPGNG